MNQFAPQSAFKLPQSLPSAINLGQLLPISTRLRQIAARFQMHHAIIHRIVPLEARLADTTYSSTMRNIGNSAWTLGDLIKPSVLNQLICGNSAVPWQRTVPDFAPKTDPLNRLDLRFGISVPFHNALGNHVALTLCDSTLSHINPHELTQFALPLIDAVLSAERARNTQTIQLSQRETDCLQWAAAGKTSIETGIILGLSQHTVNQYLTLATTKLRAVNRTHAVTKAVRLGLLNLSEI
jgi:DNA-binding CsgD family transcriptional regulator